MCTMRKLCSFSDYAFPFEGKVLSVSEADEVARLVLHTDAIEHQRASPGRSTSSVTFGDSTYRTFQYNNNCASTVIP